MAWSTYSPSNGTIKKYNETNTYSQINQMSFIDVKRMFADYGGKLVGGKGYIINYGDGTGDQQPQESDGAEKPVNALAKKEPSAMEQLKTLFETFEKDNSLQAQLPQMIADTNYYGRLILTLAKTKTGRWLLEIADPAMYNAVGAVQVNEYAATLYKRLSWADYTFIVKETWANGKITRLYYAGQEQVGIGDVIAKIPKEFVKPLEQTYPMAEIPFVQVLNRVRQNSQAFDYASLADDYNVRGLGFSVNHLIKQKLIESVLNKSRVGGVFTQEQMNQLKGSDSALSAFMSDYFIQVDNGGRSGADPFKFVVGNPALAAYDESVKNDLALYAKGCGYSFDMQQSVQQTEAEVLFQKSDDIETAALKRTIWTNALTKLFERLAVNAGILTREQLEKQKYFSIDLNENVILHPLQMGTILQENVVNGFMSRVEAIAKQRSISIEAARIVKGEIDKENKADVQLAQQMAEKNGDTDGDGDEPSGADEAMGQESAIGND